MNSFVFSSKNLHFANQNSYSQIQLNNELYLKHSLLYYQNNKIAYQNNRLYAQLFI